MGTSQSKVIKRLLLYVRPHSKKLIHAFIILFFATAADVAGPLIIRVFIDHYLTPRILEPVTLFLLGAGYIALFVLSSVLQYCQLISFNTIALEIIHQIRVEIFSKVQYLSLRYFDQTPAGVLVSKITNDTEAIKELYLSVLSTYVQNILFLFGIFVAMFILDFRFAIFCLIFIPLILLLMGIYRTLSTRLYRILRKELGHLNAKLNETLQGMSIIQAMNQEKRFREEFGHINERYYQAAFSNIKLDSFLTRPAVDIIYTLAFAAVLSYFGVQSLAAVADIGVLYAFINYLDRFFEPVNTMMMRLSQLQQSVIAAERVFELLDEENMASRVKEIEGVSMPEINKGKIEFRNVSFSYDGVTEVLKNISLTVEPGQTVALVGHTGSGKSTISSLLLRFYPVSKGEILMDGIPLEAYSESELREKIGLVAQDPFLFVGSVKENIRMKRP